MFWTVWTGIVDIQLGQAKNLEITTNFVVNFKVFGNG